jgi:hypothetical protein
MAWSLLEIGELVAWHHFFTFSYFEYNPRLQLHRIHLSRTVLAPVRRYFHFNPAREPESLPIGSKLFPNGNHNFSKQNLSSR